MSIGTILILSLFANNVRPAGPIGLGEALIVMFRPWKDDSAYGEYIGWHLAHAD